VRASQTQHDEQQWGRATHRSPVARTSQTQPRPQNNYAYQPETDDTPSAWNPAGVAWLGFFMLPMGLALCHMNWKTLGREDKQASSMGWMIIGIVLFGVEQILNTFTNMWGHFGMGLFLNAVCFLFFLVWYFAGGCREQALHVNYELMGGYRKKPWGIPLLVFFGAWIMLVVIRVSVMASAFRNSGWFQLLEWLGSLEE
jgi:hypothetical protein